MTNEYDRLKNEFKAYFDKAKKSDRWLRVASNNGLIYGKVESVGPNALYLNPSLVFEENKEGTVSRLEDKLATIISFSSLNGIQPISMEYLEFMLNSKTEKKTGFNK